MTRENVLDEAKKCVCGQREQDYGSPESNFCIIADLWSAYTGHKYTPVDVANMMILLKLARIKNGGGTGDSFVDIAGYAACGGEIRAKKDDECSNRRSVPSICKKCMHWQYMSCLFPLPCGTKNDYAEFEQRPPCNGDEISEDKRDDPCNTCCFGPDVFENPIDICNSCKNHEFYTKSVDYMWRKLNEIV